MNHDKHIRLAAIIALQLAGILAGTQLGKIAPLVDWYRNDVGFSLVMIGWLTATIGVFVAFLAVPAGWAVARIGPRRTFAVSSALLTLGGLVLAGARSPEAIFGARLIEGAGYLVLVIAIPAILSALSPPAWRAPVLAIWSGFVPIGFAAADFLSAGLLPGYGAQTYLATATIGFVLLAVVSALFLRRVPDFPTTEDPTPPAVQPGAAGTLDFNVVLIALSFGIYVVLSIGFFTFLPSFVGSSGSAIFLTAGTIALLVPVGNILTGILVHGKAGLFLVALAAGGYFATMLTAIPAFSGSSPIAATLSAAVLAISGGVTASALFAVIPLIVPRGGSVAVAIGLVAQCGGIGTLVGPPLAGFVIERYGWIGFGLYTALAAGLGIACLAPLWAKRRRKSLAV